MTWRPTEPQGDTFVPTGARYIRENFQCIENVLGADILRDGKKYEVFPPGTRLWFYQDTAPDGWTIVADAADCLLGCKTGEEGSVFASGGTISGTWLQSDHVLSVDQMPSHNHIYQKFPFYDQQNSNEHFAARYATYERWFRNEETSTVGGNQPHNHGDTWRPLTAVGIICEKT